MPDGMALFQYLSRLRKPLRTRDFVAHAKLAGFPDFSLPIGSFLSAQIRVQGNHVGNIYIGEKQRGPDFTLEDEKP